MGSLSEKLVVLHIGDECQYNPKTFQRFASEFKIIRPSIEQRQRPQLIQALKDRVWGDFHAIFRPFWNTGGEMGRWDRELIPLLPETVKIFASAGAGYDWADVDILAEYGIVYCNGASASSEAVADMALYHILSVFRNMVWSSLAARSGDPVQWLDAHKYATMTAHNPHGHVLAIIGLGQIGYMIARKARLGLGMEIHYHDIVRKSQDIEKSVDAVYHDSLDGMLSQADYVVLATPFGGKKIITKETLKRFKRGSRFVNIARGSLVDEDALVEALETHHLFAAGLDVFEHEPNVPSALIAMRNVSLTCHTAGGAIETQHGFERLAMENIEGLLLNGKALTPVNAHLMRP